MADFARIKKVPGLDRIISLVISNIQEALTEAQSLPPLRGQLIKSISVSSGANSVNHSLGREAQGYVVTKQTSAVNLTYGSQVDLTKILVVNSSGSSTIDLWVF